MSFFEQVYRYGTREAMTSIEKPKDNTVVLQDIIITQELKIISKLD